MVEGWRDNEVRKDLEDKRSTQEVNLYEGEHGSEDQKKKGSTCRS